MPQQANKENRTKQVNALTSNEAQTWNEQGKEATWATELETCAWTQGTLYTSPSFVSSPQIRTRPA